MYGPRRLCKCMQNNWVHVWVGTNVVEVEYVARYAQCMMHDAHWMWEMRECTGERRRRRRFSVRFFLHPVSFYCCCWCRRCCLAARHRQFTSQSHETENIHMTRCVYNIACINACVCTCKLVCVLNCQAKIDRNLLMCMLNASAHTAHTAYNAIGCRLVLIQRLKTTTTQTIVCIIHQRWLLFAYWTHRQENLTPHTKTKKQRHLFMQTTKMSAIFGHQQQQNFAPISRWIWFAGRVLLKFEIVCFVCVMDAKREVHMKYISYTIPCRDSIRFDSIGRFVLHENWRLWHDCTMGRCVCVYVDAHYYL